jgi:hypothetical protein
VVFGSPVKRRRREYKKVIRKLERINEGVASSRDFLAANIDIFSSHYHGEGDSSAGEFVTTFESALDRWGKSAGSLVGRFGVYGRAVSEVDSRLRTLRYRVSVLTDMADEEDAGRDEYTEEEIPF